MGVSELIARAKEYLPPEKVAMVEDAYHYAVEFRDTPDTRVSFRAADQAIQGLATLNTEDELAYGQPVPVYLYASEPLHSWSANNLTFDQYLQADTLDGRAVGNRLYGSELDGSCWGR